MDDDCQRGLSKAYQVLVTLIDYEAIDAKNKSNGVNMKYFYFCDYYF